MTPHGSSGAQETEKGLLAGAHAVKAFNTIFGHVLARCGPLDAGGLYMTRTLKRVASKRIQSFAFV